MSDDDLDDVPAEDGDPLPDSLTCYDEQQLQRVRRQRYHWPAIKTMRLRRTQWGSRRARMILSGLSAILAALAAILLLVGTSAQHHAPQAPAAGPAQPVATSPRAEPTTSPTIAAAAPTNKAAMQISIPAIGVQAAEVISVGLNPNRTVQVPPLNHVDEAGWYKYSPLPGQTGPSIILGHIDSAVAGKGVFYSLGTLKPGDVISVLRPDHYVADFVVSRTAEYPKKEFPTQQVYGDTAGAELRLITCGGQFDSSARSYRDNIVAFATLTSLHHD